MSYMCKITGKKPMVGNTVSHANNKTKRRYMPNLRKHRFYLESQKRYITLRVSAKGMRTIDKLGLENVLEMLRAQGEAV